MIRLSPSTSLYSICVKVRAFCKTATPTRLERRGTSFSQQKMCQEPVDIPLKVGEVRQLPTEITGRSSESTDRKFHQAAVTVLAVGRSTRANSTLTELTGSHHGYSACLFNCRGGSAAAQHSQWVGRACLGPVDKMTSSRALPGQAQS